MAERPRSGDTPDDPDYDWLYPGRGQGDDQGGTGDQTRPIRRPRPDETRMMPTQQRPGSAGQQPGRQPSPQSGQQSGDRAAQPAAQQSRPAPASSSRDETPPPIAPTPTPSKGGGGGRRRPSWKTIRRVIVVLLVAWLVFLVVVPIMAWSDVSKVDYEPEGERPESQPGRTYLMVGTDSRAGLSEEQRKELSTGDAGGSRTDTIMLLHVGSGKSLLMSIPRDSQVDVPGHGTSKINAAFAWGGPELLTETIEQNTGIRVDDYVEIGMGGVVGLVDAVGGITVCPTFDMKDKDAGLDIEEGCQEVDGTTALGYARSRKTDPQYGDITRAQHQREVVGAIGDEVLSVSTFLNPFRYWNLAHAMPDAFAVGKGMGPIDAGRWALAMSRIGSSGMTCGVPISDLSVQWDEERSAEMFDYIINDQTDDIPAGLCTPTGLPKSVTG
ncbi:LCP family protein [Nocardioides insulae]|uniref:LCP family protein n=1 Tax=Nocardioides insulae TaxID=394734 RepID=UPI000429BC74|nr:LCP family protein [Nocardioides insulae]